MATDIQPEPLATDPAVMAEMIKAAEYAAKGVRDPEVMHKAFQEINRLREKNAVLYPGPDVGVDIIRKMRDERYPGSDGDE